MEVQVVWTAYMKYRATLRGFDLSEIEQVVRHSGERYFDTATGRLVVVGRIGTTLVTIPCEVGQGWITPITVHATTRQQIRFRLKTGRFTHE